MNFWLSWYGPVGEAFELHSPWWLSGFEPGGRDIIVAAVRAPDEEAAWKVVVESYDNPVEIERRFISNRSLDWGAVGGVGPLPEGRLDGVGT